MARDPSGALPDAEDVERRLREIFPQGQALAQPSVIDPNTGLQLFAWLRLDNAQDLAVELGVGSPALLTVGAREPDPRFARDAAIVLAAYARWGGDCVDRFEGDFAFVILDPRGSSAFAARDALGIRPLYFAVTPEVFVASPSAAVFDLFPTVDTSVRWEWLADFIHGMSADWRETPFSGVHRVPPGHWLRVTAEDVVERRYHRFDSESPWEDTRDRRWLEAYRNELIRAVSVRTEPSGLIGVESSGGLDSSSVLGVMAHAHPERIEAIHTFGFVECIDEPEYILETSIAHGITHNHVFTRGGANPSNPLRAWQAIGYPTEHGNVLSHFPFYDLAAELGVSTLHSGHGGDETVTYNGGLALAELRSRRRWTQLIRDLPGHPSLRAARLAKQLLRPQGAPTQEQFLAVQSLALSPLSLDIVAQRSMEQRAFTRSQKEAPYDSVNDFIIRDRLSPGAAVRTSDGSLVAASLGVEYRWPLLDRRLIQQYLRTPSIWKYGEGTTRYLHRRAIAGIVPGKVARKPRKSMGAPHQPWLRQMPSVFAADRRRRSDEAWQSPHAQTVDFLERLQPQVRELLDPTRVQRLITLNHAELLPSDSGKMALMALDKSIQLSVWLSGGVFV